MQGWVQHDIDARPAVTLSNLHACNVSTVMVTGAVQERVRYEADALRQEAELCPQHMPEVYHYDEQYALIVMQYLAPPHVILRKVKRTASNVSSCTWAGDFRPANLQGGQLLLEYSSSPTWVLGCLDTPRAV